MKRTLYKLFFLAMILNPTVFASDYTLEDLNQLRSLGMISDEEYDIFLLELTGELEREKFYNLKVNGTEVGNNYPVVEENGKKYYSLVKLFNYIGYTNYSIKSDKLTVVVGTDQKKITFDKTEDPNNILIESNDFFIDEELFKRSLAAEFYTDIEKELVAIRLNFETTEEINEYLDRVKEGLIDAKNSGSILFTNKKELIDLGYLKLNLEGQIIKEKNDLSETKNKDWFGSLEYQSSFLYGEFTASYSLDQERFNQWSLHYPEIYKDHSLSIEKSYHTDSNEFDIFFKKEEGYYIEDKEYIIRQKVPVGSKVELSYYGFSIDVKTADNGEVEFRNSLIQENREYELLVYPPSGQLYTITIDTTANYQQQNKGEFEYDFRITDKSEFDRPFFESNIFYGLTDHLTMSFGYSQEPEEYNHFHNVNSGIIYSNYISRFPYTLVLGGEKAVSSENYSREKYKYNYLGQIDIYDFKFIYSEENFSEYYTLKNNKALVVEYSPIPLLDLSYSWMKEKSHYDYIRDNQVVRLDFNKGFGEFLFTFNYEKNIGDETNIESGVYYTGLKNYNINLQTNWDSESRDNETTLKISNKNIFNLFDYDIEFGYSEKYKEKFTLRFTLDYDNWLTGNFEIDKNGNQIIRGGINRVFDLKDISQPLESMDSSRVKVTTYHDQNNNLKMDSFEEKISYVDVKIGSQSVETDENGEAWIFGVPNNIIYGLETIVKRPSYTVTDTKLEVYGNQVGTIEAHIPIKKMLALFGHISIDNNFDILEKNSGREFGNILVKILNPKTLKEIDVSNLESDGTFYIDGLLTGKYVLEVNYLNQDKILKKIQTEIELKYNSESDENEKIFELKNNSIYEFEN